MDIREDSNTDVVFTKAIPRFLDLFDDVGVKATFFVVGKDALKKCNRSVIKDISKRGHEIANHTMNHIHHFSSLPYEQKSSEIENAEKVLKKISGQRTVGLRTPGYNVDEEVIEILEKRKYAYESSINPTFFSPLIKLKVSLLANGNQKSSGMGRLSYMFAPTTPYRPDKKRVWRKGDLNVMQMPVSVIPYIRFPFFASALFQLRIINQNTMLFYKTLYNFFRKTSSFLNFETHAIELSDMNLDGINSSMKKQPGLTIPVKKKYDMYKEILTMMKRDYEIMTLKDASEKYR